MRKISYIFLCVVMVSGCSGFLNQDNRSNQPTDDFYNTSIGYESLRNAMYSSLRELFSTTPDLFVGGSDIYGDGKSESVPMTYFTYTSAASEIKNFYQNCFKGIQLCNAVLSYSKTTEPTSSVAIYVDEARFIRAWYYFQLVQQFGGVALANEMYTSAIMEFPRNSLKECYEFIISEFEYLAGNSHLYDRSKGPGNANKRAAQFFLAKVYLTRGWLNGEDYESQEENIAQDTDFENALKYALQAIGGEAPSASIEEVFDIANESHSEFFWTIQYSSASLENLSRDGCAQQSLFGAYLGGSEYPLNKAINGNYSPLLYLHQLYSRGDGRYEQTFMMEQHGNSDNTGTWNGYFNFYNAKNTSPIFIYFAPWWATDADIAAWKADDPYGQKSGAVISLTVKEGGIAPSNGATETYKNRRHMDEGVPCIRKFDDYTASSMANRSTTCSTHDVSVARLGEAYLIAAEAALETEDKTAAAKYIRILRSRPGTIKSGYESLMDVTAADINIDFILAERAREMAGEYVRWTDIKRTHKLFEYIEAHHEDDIVSSNFKGTDGKWKCLRPIPQSALDLNQAEIKQNPGY